jgi:hypothetical protein
MNDLITALQILSQYCDKSDSVHRPTHCEHDVLYVTCVNPSNVSKDDLKKLEILGFYPDADIKGFRSSRFGES